MQLVVNLTETEFYLGNVGQCNISWEMSAQPTLNDLQGQDNIMTQTFLKSQSDPIKLGYRPDIDGLRAVAVIAVVMFHCDFAWLPGGFVGVDVFFVISGFLITWIVNFEVEYNKFSFVKFYLRRARRILPAMIGVVSLFALSSFFLLTPDEFKQYSKSAISALLGVSNIVFFRNTDYFSSAAHLDPFLMTWSLGVEEQFYVFLPFILLALNKLFFWQKFTSIAAMVVFCLVLSIWLTPLYPQAAFYLLPTRAWELGIGALLALWMQRGNYIAIGGVQNNLLAGIGFLSVSISILFFNEATKFPGAAALIPVLGTTAILATPNSIFHSLLTLPWMRRVGLLSYSWYLYHWPFIAVARNISPGDPSQWELAFVALISLLFAYLSWRFVEQPFRHSGDEQQRVALLRYAFIVVVLAASLLGVIAMKGFPGRLSSEAVIASEYKSLKSSVDCIVGYGGSAPRVDERCWTSSEETKFALLGDSHANALEMGLRKELARVGQGLVALTKASCPLMEYAARSIDAHPSHARECHDFNQSVIQKILDDSKIEVVILTGFWGAAAVKRDSGGLKWYGPAPAPKDPMETVRFGLSEVSSRFIKGGKRVIILGDVPFFKFNPLQMVSGEELPTRQWLMNFFSAADAVSTHHAARERAIQNYDQVEKMLSEVGDQFSGVTYVPLNQAFCDVKNCRFRGTSGEMFYIDGQHLSEDGAYFAFSQNAEVSEVLGSGFITNR